MANDCSYVVIRYANKALGPRIKNRIEQNAAKATKRKKKYSSLPCNDLQTNTFPDEKAELCFHNKCQMPACSASLMCFFSALYQNPVCINVYSNACTDVLTAGTEQEPVDTGNIVPVK